MGTDDYCLDDPNDHCLIDYYWQGVEDAKEAQRRKEIAEKEKFALFSALRFARDNGMEPETLNRAYIEFDWIFPSLQAAARENDSMSDEEITVRKAELESLLAVAISRGIELGHSDADDDYIDWLKRLHPVDHGLDGCQMCEAMHNWLIVERASLENDPKFF